MLIKLLLAIAVLFLLILLIGLALPKERVVTRTGQFPIAPEVLYRIITDNNDWKYRTNLKDLVILKDDEGMQVWDEYTEDGSVIRFTTREKIPETFYSFDMESKLFTGYWEATFKLAEDGGSIFTATEHIRVKNPFVKTLYYLFFNVGKLMDAYQNDLRGKVERENL